VRDDDAVAFVVVEERERLHHPEIEASTHMACDFGDDVASLLHPREFLARRRGEDRFLAFFAVISSLHRRTIRMAAAAACYRCSYFLR